MLSNEVEIIWNQIVSEVEILLDRAPELTNFYYSYILQHKSFDMALSYILSNILSDSFMSAVSIREIINNIYIINDKIIQFAIKDITAICNSSSMVNFYSDPLLYLKGFHALQVYRINNFLWHNKKKSLALYFRNKISLLFSIDICPDAIIGSGIVLNHAIGIVIGGTSVIKDNVFISQFVTLDSVDKTRSLKYPKIEQDVFIGVGATILGDVQIGCKAKIKARSVVLASVPSGSVVEGVLTKTI